MMPLKDIDAVLKSQVERKAHKDEEKDLVKDVAKATFGIVMGVGATLFLATTIDLHSPMDLLASAGMIYYVVVGARATA